MRDAIQKGKVCCTCVETVFIVAGGNTTQNCRKPHEIDAMRASCVSLLEFTKSSFISAKINMFSLIPRKLADNNHHSRMLATNSFMASVCDLFNCRFVPIFSHFLHKSKLYFKNYASYTLNRKLFINKDKIHFTDKGNSVLAKVSICIIYSPVDRY